MPVEDACETSLVQVYTSVLALILPSVLVYAYKMSWLMLHFSKCILSPVALQRKSNLSNLSGLQLAPSSSWSLMQRRRRRHRLIPQINSPVSSLRCYFYVERKHTVSSESSTFQNIVNFVQSRKRINYCRMQ